MCNDYYSVCDVATYGTATRQNDDNESLYLHGLTNWVRNYYVAHACVVCNDYYSVCDVNTFLSYISNTSHTY